VDPRAASWKAVLGSSGLFMLAHPLWLAAVITGVIYAQLYRRTGTLWAPIIAHAVTNGVLGIWVVATGQWQFW
jgi:CAAX prenyl protease-like protein